MLSLLRDGKDTGERMYTGGRGAKKKVVQRWRDVVTRGRGIATNCWMEKGAREADWDVPVK